MEINTMDRLKLVAFDNDDLGIIAAHVQDSVLRIADLNYERANQRFVLLLNRFVWENAGSSDNKSNFERRKAVLHFERVSNVQVQNMDQKKRGEVVSLLTLKFSPSTDSDECTVELIFAGGALVRLSVECLEAQLTDMAGSWETKSRPAHEETKDD